MKPLKCAVTGGCGFIGAYLVREMVRRGWDVVVIDNCLRGQASRLESVLHDIEYHAIDIRDESLLQEALRGCEVVFHLAAINGTENFYKHPELVLDVGMRGMLSVVGACKALGIPDLVVASSAEVYQDALEIPTPESVPLMLPDSLNPRYSYGGSKLISELIAFNYAREHFRKVQVFRPHNVYGPDMGYKHVIPQFIQRALQSVQAKESDILEFVIQGHGEETRAFAYIDDVVKGILMMYEHGKHREIYHIGNDEEVSILQLAKAVADQVGYQFHFKHELGAKGGPARRCPHIQKMKQLGYEPEVHLLQGLSQTVPWYQSQFEFSTMPEHSLL